MAHIKIIDTHAHLQDDQFRDDWMDVLNRAETAGVKTVLLPGSDLDDSLRALQLAGKDERQRLVCAAGIHPHEAGSASSDALERLQAVIHEHKGKNLVAVGEIGLDYHYDFSPRVIQQEVFMKQAEIAAREDLPMIVHSREATADMLAVLDTLKKRGHLRTDPGVFHCFSGSQETAEILLAMGFYLGFDGPVTFKNAKKALKVIENCPHDKLLVETDSPYLAPVPHRGKRNDPSFLPLIIEKIAECWQRSTEYAAAVTTENAMRLFRLQA